jgi:hypothetical protein
MNDSHRVIWVDVQISLALFTRITERCKTLGIPVNRFLSDALEGALPSEMKIKHPPYKVGQRKKK